MNFPKLLLGTTNSEKIKIVQNALVPLPLEVITPLELDLFLTIIEDGASPLENAQKKARAFYLAAALPTLAIDAGLYIENFPAEKQPGAFVRRIPGLARKPSDKELLEYYQQELLKYGGTSEGYFRVALVLITSLSDIFTEIYSLPLVFTAEASSIHLLGAPLSSLAIDSSSGKYLSELSSADRPDAKWIFNFVKGHLSKFSPPE